MIKIIFIIFLIVLYLTISFKENFYNNNNIKLNGINSFDKYMYINLLHRKDRKENIENELKKMNIKENKIIRINAIRNKYNGHIGCCKSHIKALKIARKLKLNNVVIFEDDFIFTLDKETIDNKINHFLEKYKNFNVIMLTTINKHFEDINDEHVKKVIHATSPSGYIVHKNFYNILIRNLKDSVNKMEKEMENYDYKKKKFETKHAFDQHWFSLQKKSNWYSFFPYLGKDSHFGGSSIMGNIEAFLTPKIYNLSLI